MINENSRSTQICKTETVVDDREGKFMPLICCYELLSFVYITFVNIAYDLLLIVNCVLQFLE